MLYRLTSTTRLPVNREYKDILNAFTIGTSRKFVTTTIVDLRTSVVQLIHARWVINIQETMVDKKALIIPKRILPLKAGVRGTMNYQVDGGVKKE